MMIRRLVVASPFSRSHALRKSVDRVSFIRYWSVVPTGSSHDDDTNEDGWKKKNVVSPRRTSRLRSIATGASCRAYSPSIAPLLPYHATRPTLDAVPGYSMAMMKSLRSTAGAPVVECKKALEAAIQEVQREEKEGGTDEYDQQVLQAAIDWLRQHGAAKASSKVADRTSTEGLVGFASDPENPQSAVLVKVASETDFAGRSDAFVKLVENIAKAALQHGRSNSDSTNDTSTRVLSKDDLAQIKLDEEGRTVQELLDEAILAIRENISVPIALQLKADTPGSAMWVGYVHNRVHPQSTAGTAAAAVLLESAAGRQDKNVAAIAADELEEIGKKLAMHVVAARPQYLEQDQVPETVLEKEKEILRQQQSSSGKPPEIVEKIIQGRLRKFYEETCLLEQGHMVEDKNPKVRAYLQERGITLKQFEALFIA